MAFKTVTYKVLGMKQDTSESAFDSKYAYENRNIRIDARNNNTLLSIENERGNTQITSINVWRYLMSGDDLPYSVLEETINTLPFVVIGQVVIDKYLVLFGKINNTYDVIARLEYISTGTRAGWNMVYFYNDRGLNFSTSNPIEALPNIETEKIKKVYWVDGLNPPRVINIVNENYIDNASIYNLTATLALKEQFIVTKDLSRQGLFTPGKVQFCFTYFNDTDTESNIIEMSPLFDVTLFDDGVAQNATGVNTNGVFNIQITNLDSSFKYVKIYCMEYSSLSGLPRVTSLPKITIPQSVGASIHLVDTGKNHIEDSLTFAVDSISSKQSFIPYTLGVKDNTLFFGNIKLLKPTVQDFQFHFGEISEYLKPIGVENTSNAVYQYRPSLTTYKGSNYDYKGFKKHNWYRLGFIAQYYSGEWSDVIYLGDAQCTISSETTINGDQIIPKIPNFKYSFSTEDYNTLQNLYDSGYRKIKPVCVVPNEIERTVIAQGILSPTVYLGGNRISLQKPFAQASWFFRPTMVKSPLTVNGTLYAPEYPYTLRSQYDFLSLNTNYTANNWWKHDIRPIVNFNRLYREYRHGFSLPPKDRVNAELDSSDASLNAYFIYKESGVNLFADSSITIGFDEIITPLLTTADANFLGREVTPGTDNITYESMMKVLLYDKTYKITGYENTVFIDESIVTFNSPEIDYGGVIGYNAALDLTGTDIYLNNTGVAQITSSYSNVDITGNLLPTDAVDEFKLFEGGEGRCIYNLDRANNDDLDNIWNVIKFNNGNGGYRPILAGPWWYEWIYALGFVPKTGSSDPFCTDEPYQINHALAIGAETVNDHYVLRTATGAESTHFKQSWSGQLYNSGGTFRPLITYSTSGNPSEYYLAYGSEQAPIAIHNFLAKDQGPAENYPNTTDCGGKADACAAWLAYGLTAAVRYNTYGWMYPNIFLVTNPADFLSYTGFDSQDTWSRTVIYRPFGYDSFHRKGYSPAGALNTLGTDLDNTVLSPYGSHAYSNSEVNFPHVAFDKRYSHIIYPFMDKHQPLNGNTSLYHSPEVPVPELKRTTNLLYSKNTIYYSTLVNSGTRLASNINPNKYIYDEFEHAIDYDWLQDAFSSNTVLTYQGSFKTATPFLYYTHHLVSALRWYKGFNTLNKTLTPGILSISKPLNFKTFTDDVMFAGFLKPLYKKCGYMQNMGLEFTTTIEGAPVMTYSDTEDEYDAFNVDYDTPTVSSLELNYLSTPHVVSSYKLANGAVVTLPKISVTGVTNNSINYNSTSSTWESSYYCKEFVKHEHSATGEIVTETNLDEFTKEFTRQALYPHTGCWAKIYPDHSYGIQVDDSGNTYPFWGADLDDEYHYAIAQSEVFIEEAQLLSQGIRSIDLNTVGLLHIGEYIKIDNFTTSPYDSSNVQLYDWMPCGESYQIDELLASLYLGKDASINFLEGDIYFQRYNCLKTTGLTPENEEFNSIVEHASVYIESYINLDGRYDQHNYMDIDQIRKYDQNTYTQSLNPAYSRKNDFITYKQVDYNLYNSDTYHFPTAIIWSLTKIYGETIDSWSIIPLESTYYVDGVCGEITSLKSVGNNLICFQQKGVSIIDFNAKALIQTDTLSPISISTQNSVKMQGVTYISKQTGTFNKHSIVTTPNGLCFVDNDKQSILKISNDYSLSNLSDLNGMTVWTRENMSSTEVWSPVSFISDINNAFTGYYDSVHHDIYFTNNQHCLVFNEALGAFTSFYSYESIPYMINYQDKLIATYYSLLNSNESSLWLQHTGGYSTLFGVRPIVNSIELLVNENALYDKVFNFVEFYYDCFGQDISRPGSPYTLLSTDAAGFPRNQIYSIDARNEYQSGSVRVNSLSLRQKFRLWRMEIPRDTVHKLDRMRSPWLFVKLTLHNTLGLRQLLHTLSVNYTLTNQPLKEN